MPKNKPLFIILVLVTLLAATSYRIFIDDEQSGSENIVSQSVEVKEKSKNKRPDTNNLLKNKTQINFIIDQIKKNKVYDNDPITNLAIYGAKFGSCYTLKFIEELQQSNKHTMKWSEVQLIYFNKTNNECLDSNKQFPEFEEFIQLQLAPEASLKAESQLAKYLDFNKWNFTENETLDYLSTIGQYYPDLIPHSIRRTYQYNISNVLPDLENILQTSNKSYLYKIENLSINFMACQLGANCTKTSQLMFEYCSSEENFCVNDFIELYNTRLSPGVKADIQLALPYFKKLYHVN